MKISALKELWANKHDQQGRIDITVFFVNIFLFLCHVFLMIIYVAVNHSFMICVNIISLLLYFLCIPICYKNIDKYLGITFLEIWLHLICGILSFGWTPCYQNWCFGMVAAYFLPAFSKNSNMTKRRPFHYAFLIMFSYFFLATFYPLVHFSFTTELNIYMNSILFIANNAFVFIAIILFALFYTSRNNRTQKELSKKAEYDELTDLYNRHALNEIGKELIDNAKKNKEAFYVAILDIDFFKKINDEYGHASGDLVLKKLADIIRTYSNEEIIPGRWGGEEFVMIAPQYIKYSEFTDKLEDMRAKISKEKFEIENDKKINLTISIGASKITEYKNIEKAISKADVNLYTAKKTGRNKLIK